MEFTEIIDIEDNLNSIERIIVEEPTLKQRHINKIFKVAGSYSYVHQDYKDRFLTWSAKENVIYFKESSTQFDIINGKIEIQLEKSKVVNISVFETQNCIEFLIAGSLSIIRFSLHHPSKLRLPANSTSFRHSIFSGVIDLNEIQGSITPFFDVNCITTANAVLDYNDHRAYFNYGLSNGHVYSFEVAESSTNNILNGTQLSEGHLLSKLFSGLIPSFRGKNDYGDFSVLQMTYLKVLSELYLATISRDNKLKIWNLRTKVAIAVEDLLVHAIESNTNFNRSPSTINYTSLIASHQLKSCFNDTHASITGFDDVVLIHFHCRLGSHILKNWLVIKVLSPNERTSDNKQVDICFNTPDKADSTELIDFTMAYDADLGNTLGVWMLLGNDENDCDFDTANSIYKLEWRPLTSEYCKIRYCSRLYEPIRSCQLLIRNSTQQDIEEQVLDVLFRPGNSSIRAVLNTLNKDRDKDIIDYRNTNLNNLKLELVLLVESRIEKEVEPYLDNNQEVNMHGIKRKCWKNLLQEVLSEHMNLVEPLSILYTSQMSLGLLRGVCNNISLMRQSTQLEHVMSNPRVQLNNRVLQKYYGEHAGSGVALLHYLYNSIRIYNNSEVWNTIKHDIYIGAQSPTDFIHELASLSGDLPPNIQSRLETAPVTLDNTVDLLEKFELLDYTFDPEKDTFQYNLSIFGTSLLHYTLRQLINDRIIMSVSLLALITPRTINSSISGQMNSLVKRLTTLIKSLVSMLWLLNLRQVSTQNLSDAQVHMCRKLNLLESRSSYDTTNLSQYSDLISLRVIKCLQQNMRLSNFQATNNLTSTVSSFKWLQKIHEQISALLMHLNPISDSFSLVQIVQYFITYNLPLELIDYLKFLTKSEPVNWWIGADECLVNFLLGFAYLLLNKPYIVVQYWSASITKSDITSSLLPTLLLENDIDNDENGVGNNMDNIDSQITLQTTLITKFIDILEDASVELIHSIKLIKIGIDVCDRATNNEEAIKNKSLLLTPLFQNYMDLNKFEEAMKVLLTNPDIDRQKVCLRKMITTLCDADKLDVLMDTDYGNLKDEFFSIVTSRANTCDLSNLKNRRLYDLLFSCYLKIGNLHGAAQSILELALRLDNDLTNQIEQRMIPLETSTIMNTLQKQLGSYLSCISVCELLSKDEGLFVLPDILARIFDPNYRKSISTINQLEKMDTGETTLLCEPNEELEDINDDIKKDGRSVVTVEQIRRQFYLLRSHLEIINNTECTAPHELLGTNILRVIRMTPIATRNSLLDISIYKEAIVLTDQFQLDPTSILDTISMRCINVHKSCLDRSELKEQENIIEALEELNNTAGYSSIACLRKLVWLFLQELLLKFDNSPNGTLCIRVAHKLLVGSATHANNNISIESAPLYGLDELPSWLVELIVNDKKAYSELIRVFLNVGLIEQAAELALKWLDEKIDEISYRHEQLVYLQTSTNWFSSDKSKWISFTVLFRLIDVLQKIRNDGNLYAEEMLDSIETKLNLIGTYEKPEINRQEPMLPQIQSS